MSVEPYGLVALSSAFVDRELFESKVSLYLASMPKIQIFAINDVSGLAREFFKEQMTDSLPTAMPLREKRQLVRGSQFALHFWDGTGIDDFIYLSQLYRVPTRVIPVATTRVVNKDRGDEFDVYIGRGTPWGNPFAIGEGVDRAAAVEMYKQYFIEKFVNDAAGNRSIRTLKGKVLGCHCKPNACHGDIIAKYLNGLKD